ncbi:hypothetical protein QNI19_19255 [Cytophagaceae bacterium DM2B3-1]|uniref:Lipocalin-like domain-containing protein n=1 Tax=Xanthocytophaga flava TaxID=3048013 RepID=A0ABT7CN18_9BACT|nr:lipocalin family protein [Xanthocytophaga flavus]MDJ1472089.1 hypothetical protein [Xanthocytophaga flavus]MDJ1495085.1 hypothetical protein [Xanthocytophaga flavus]
MYTSIQNIAWRIGKAFFVLGGLFWGGSACSEKIEPKPYTFSQLLTGKESKKWQLVAFQVVDEGQVYNARLFPCEQNDIYTFYANAAKEVEIQNGDSKCDEAEPDAYEGNWALINATATLAIPIPFLSGSSSIPFTLKQITATSFIVEYYFLDIEASYRFTFNAIQGG